MSAFNIVSWEQGEPAEAYPMSSFLTDLALPDEGDRELLKEAEALASRRFSFEERPPSSAESSLDDDEDYFEYDDLLDAAADLWDGREGSGSSSPDSFTLGYHFDVRPATKADAAVPSIEVKDAEPSPSPQMLRARSSVQSFAEAFAPKRGARSVSSARQTSADASSRRQSDSGGSTADDEGYDEEHPVSPSLTDNSDLYEGDEALLHPSSSMARAATSPIPSTPGSVYSTLSPGPQQFRPLLSPAPLDEAELAQSRRISVLLRGVESLSLAGGSTSPKPRPLSLALPSPAMAMSRSQSLASTTRHTYVRSSTVREAVPHRRPRFQAPAMASSSSSSSAALERTPSKKGRLSRFVSIRTSLPSLAAARVAAEQPRLTRDMISGPIARSEAASNVVEESEEEGIVTATVSETEVDCRSQPMSQELLAILAGQNGADLWDDESDDDEEEDAEEGEQPVVV